MQAENSVDINRPAAEVFAFLARPENHPRLRQLLKRSDFIYVADCKLATEENLRRISDCGGRFVSVMPRTWKEDALFRQCVRDGQVQWDHLLSRKNNRKPDTKLDRYDLARGQHLAHGYRLLWIRSAQRRGLSHDHQLGRAGLFSQESVGDLQVSALS